MQTSIFVYSRWPLLHSIHTYNTRFYRSCGFCIPKARLLVECRPTRDTIVWTWLSQLYLDTLFLVALLPSLVLFLSFPPLYPSHAQVRIIEQTTWGRLQIARITRILPVAYARDAYVIFFYSCLKTKVENILVVKMQCQYKIRCSKTCGMWTDSTVK